MAQRKSSQRLSHQACHSVFQCATAPFPVRLQLRMRPNWPTLAPLLSICVAETKEGSSMFSLSSTMTCRRIGYLALTLWSTILVTADVRSQIAVNADIGPSTVPATQAQERVQTRLASNAPADSPQIEMRFFIDDAKERRRLAIAPSGTDMVVQEKGTDWTAIYVIRSDALRIAVGPEIDAPMLAWERTYIFTMPSRPGWIAELKVPKVARGEVVKRDVVYRDQSQAVAPAKEPLRLEGSAKGLPPAKDGQAPWHVVYQWSTDTGNLRTRRDIAELKPDGSFVIQGAPLGGELLVTRLTREHGLCAAYIRDVQRSPVSIPADATFLGTPDVAKRRTFHYALGRMPEGTIGVGFFLDDKARLAVMDHLLPKEGTQFDELLPAGSYQVRIVVERMVMPAGPTTTTARRPSPEIQLEVLARKLVVEDGATDVWLTAKD